MLESNRQHPLSLGDLPQGTEEQTVTVGCLIGLRPCRRQALPSTRAEAPATCWRPQQEHFSLGLSPRRNRRAKFREAWRPLTRDKAMAPGGMLGDTHLRKPCSLATRAPPHIPGDTKKPPLTGTTWSSGVGGPRDLLPLPPENRGETAAPQTASLPWCPTRCLNNH